MFSPIVCCSSPWIFSNRPRERRINEKKGKRKSGRRGLSLSSASGSVVAAVERLNQRRPARSKPRTTTPSSALKLHRPLHFRAAAAEHSQPALPPPFPLTSARLAVPFSSSYGRHSQRCLWDYQNSRGRRARMGCHGILERRAGGTVAMVAADPRGARGRR
jgi:hypothetical protein